MNSQGKNQAPKALPDAGDLVAGKYRIERVIGEGGMGRVFAAHHEVLDQRVAIKLLFAEVAERPNVVERFLREAKAAARLKSDHVARVMDAGTAESGLPFIVMECLEGADLMELVKLNGPMPVDEVVDIMLQALEAIAHAHAAGIVHRDLKPSNLFLALAPDGGNIVKVLDFGIAKSLASSGEEVATLTGQNIMGSPAYMSPEQIRNARTVDTRSDLWSLGVVMYELVTGKLPFTGEGIGELLAAVLEQAPIPARSRNPDVPEAIEQAIARALRRNRDRRYQTAADFARVLAPHASPRWAPLADRIEALLANAPRSSSSTAPDGHAGRDESQPKDDGPNDDLPTMEFPSAALPLSTTPRTLAPRARAHTPRLGRVVLGVAAAATLFGALGVVAITRLRGGVRAAPAATARAAASTPTPSPTETPAATPTVAPTITPSATPGADDAGASMAAVASAPPAPGKGMIPSKPAGAPARTSGTKPPATPVRPKVLHSRE